MDLGVSGLASGFDWRGLIDQLSDVERLPQRRLRSEQSAALNRNNAYSTIKTQLSVLKNRTDSLQKPTFFDSRSVASADSTTGTASVNSGAALGSYSFNVTQMATAAKKQGSLNVGAVLSPTNSVSAVTVGGAGFSSPITNGNFTVNGVQIAIATTDTLQEVFDRINTSTGGDVTASYSTSTDAISLTSTSGEIVLGSATDSSNFLGITRLFNNGTSTISSTSALGGAKVTGLLPSANLVVPVSDGGAGAGKLKINGVEITFSISADSLQNVMDRINSSAAGVNAAYDPVNDRFSLTNKTTGDVGVSLEDVSGNFLAATGLISGSSSLERGKDILYTINGGPTQTGRSNTVGSDSSGITGLTFNSLKLGTSLVSISVDRSQIRTVIQNFIDDYNKTQTTIDGLTASSTSAAGKVTAGLLASDSEVSDIAGKLRTISFNQTSGLSGVFKSLSHIGIDSSGTSNVLTIKDSAALDAAINDNLADLKSLFSDPTYGIATRLSTYFDATIGDGGTVIDRQDALLKQSSQVDAQVIDLERRVQSNRQRLIDSFVQMETAQQQINQQMKFLQQRFSSSPT